jgi:SAM-dependent methyltransferase
MNAPQTWHHGLVAEWWAAFNTDGPEIDYYGRVVADGQPALDAGCGTGRLLLPWLRAGYDVDGSDVSADMIALCRERATAEGFDPALLVQPLHELAAPRRYRTVVVCGVFGLGSTRAQDQQGLERLHDALEPGGVLLLDNEVPYGGHMRWERWQRRKRGTFPEDWPDEPDVGRTPDGSELELRIRALDLDPLDQSVVLEMRAEKHRDGKIVASELHTLTMRGYFKDELLLMLEHAGFRDVAVSADYTEEEPTANSRFLVYRALR